MPCFCGHNKKDHNCMNGGFGAQHECGEGSCKKCDCGFYSKEIKVENWWK